MLAIGCGAFAPVSIRRWPAVRHLLPPNTLVCRPLVSTPRIISGVTNINVSLGRALARLRQGHQLSQEELAERARVHRTYVSQIERGIKSPTIKVLLRLCVALHTAPSKLLETVEQENSGLPSKRALRNRRRI